MKITGFTKTISSYEGGSVTQMLSPVWETAFVVTDMEIVESPENMEMSVNSPMSDTYAAYGYDENHKSYYFSFCYSNHGQALRFHLGYPITNNAEFLVILEITDKSNNSKQLWKVRVNADGAEIISHMEKPKVIRSMKIPVGKN